MFIKINKVIMPCIVLLGAVSATYYFVETKPSVEPLEQTEQPLLVAARQVTLQNIQPKIKVYGEIVSGREVELRALVSGEVVTVADDFVNGSSLNQDDMVITIDDFDYRANFDELSSQIKEAEAKLEEVITRQSFHAVALSGDIKLTKLYQRELKRMHELSGRGTISEKRLDNAQMDLTRQEKTTEMRRSDLTAEGIRLKQQKAVIKRLRIGLKRAQRNINRVRLTAPFDGFLADVEAQVGKRLTTNDRVARLIDVNRLEARVTLSDSQYGRLISEGPLVGRTSSVNWQVGGHNFYFKGFLHRIGARIDSASGGVQVFIRLEGMDLAKPLRPGAFVTVTMPDKIYQSVTQVPESALYDGNTIYVIQNDRLIKRRVELIARQGNDVLLRGDIRDKDRVVITRFAEIGPGRKVEVR